MSVVPRPAPLSDSVSPASDSHAPAASPNVHVRPAAVADAAWLASVSQASFVRHLHDYLTSAQPGVGRFWEVVLEHPASFPGRCFLVAETDEGERLGFADLTLVDPGLAHLSYICVVRAARGRGVARALLRAYLDRHPGVRGMRLDVFADNAPARALYDRLGFTIESTSTWWVTDVAPDRSAASAGVRFDGLHAARAWFETYGFGELTAVVGDSDVRFGRPSTRVLRCFDVATLRQPAVVAAVLREFPEIDRVLVMASGDAPPPCALGDLRAVNHSLRMSTPEIRTRLELT
ncbi:GNAT family N-acetyltransferase [Micromonospora sp. AMSO1212t]|uniref:GNAT family N-acetyltransferase n=1 Tax=Micromonospora sp. AMSO1212t TaxID=2650565 RepID=UPI00124B35F9|nr:GNAT family N-acetyltransferase [Micromonospora sp. AMSO1212t]KAB1909862.1 GNAT family N-acetyltransferase [Micromonospora sp. AMSO1212t]